MKKNYIVLLSVLFLNLSISNLKSFENKKSEIGAYFGTKIYEERHPVDNSFLCHKMVG